MEILEISNPVCFCGKPVHILSIFIVTMFLGHALCKDCGALERTHTKILNTISEYDVIQSTTQ